MSDQRRYMPCTVKLLPFGIAVTKDPLPWPGRQYGILGREDGGAFLIAWQGGQTEWVSGLSIIYHEPLKNK